MVQWVKNLTAVVQVSAGLRFSPCRGNFHGPCMCHLKKKSCVNNFNIRSSHHGAAEMNPTRNNEVAGSNSGLAHWVKDLALP